jgi:hypothetical protein
VYLAEYAIDGAPWVQASAKLTYPRPLHDARTLRWWERFRTLLRNLDSVPQTTVALRVEVGSRLRVNLFATAPGSDLAALRRTLGSLTQLGILANGEVEYARTRAEHDRALDCPRLQCRVALPSMTTGGETWLAFNFRVADFLNDLIAEAKDLEHVVSYHVNVEPFSPDADWQRAAAKNALRISQVAGVPSVLEALQQQLAENLMRATHVCEEFLGVQTVEARDWLAGVLARRFHDAYGLDVGSEFSFDENGHEGSLVATRHQLTFEPLGVAAVAGAAVNAQERLRLLAWEPTEAVLALMEAPPRDSQDVNDDRPLASPAMPEPYMGTGAYAFVSYKREDLDRIQDPVAALTHRGHRIWYDKGIPGGVEWDALIEERVQHCAVVLVFLTANAVASKFVRRELKFADSLNKPIVAVRLDNDLSPSHGLAMLLNQYQIIDATSPSFRDELDRAVRFLRLL